jgi:hypothetical protein
MTIHQNFIFYEWILIEALSRLTGSGVSVTVVPLVRAAFACGLRIRKASQSS